MSKIAIPSSTYHSIEKTGAKEVTAQQKKIGQPQLRFFNAATIALVGTVALTIITSCHFVGLLALFSLAAIRHRVLKTIDQTQNPHLVYLKWSGLPFVFGIRAAAPVILLQRADSSQRIAQSSNPVSLLPSPAHSSPSSVSRLLPPTLSPVLEANSNASSPFSSEPNSPVEEPAESALDQVPPSSSSSSSRGKVPPLNRKVWDALVAAQSRASGSSAVPASAAITPVQVRAESSSHLASPPVLPLNFSNEHDAAELNALLNEIDGLNEMNGHPPLSAIQETSESFVSDASGADTFRREVAACDEFLNTSEPNPLDDSASLSMDENQLETSLNDSALQTPPGDWGRESKLHSLNKEMKKKKWREQQRGAWKRGVITPKLNEEALRNSQKGPWGRQPKVFPSTASSTSSPNK